MGKYHSCWEALDPARQTFIKIAEEIKEHLEKHSDPVTKPVTWTMYMIGRKRETAEPTIMFCSKEEDCRKKVKKTVVESGILDRYPGVRIGDCSRPPDFEKLVRLAGDISAKLQLARCSNTNFLPSNQGEENEPCLGSIFREASDAVCGSRILASTGENGSTFRKATAGGILRSGNRFFYLTVAHAFLPTTDHAAASITEDSDCDFEYDIGEDRYSDEEDGSPAETTSRGSVTPELLEYASSDDSGKPMDTLPSPSSHLDVASRRESCEEASTKEIDTLNSFKNTKTAPLELPGRSFEDIGHFFMKSPELDYALIEISKTSLRTFNRIPLKHSLVQGSLYPKRVVKTLPLNTIVFAVTSSAGLLEGTISGTPSFIMQRGSTRQNELWTVRLNGKFAEVDCGSWVVEARSGNFLGHIVSGCPESGVAYIVPAYLVLTDAKIRCDLELELSTDWGADGEEELEWLEGYYNTPMHDFDHDAHIFSATFASSSSKKHPNERKGDGSASLLFNSDLEGNTVKNENAMSPDLGSVPTMFIPSLASNHQFHDDPITLSSYERITDWFFSDAPENLSAEHFQQISPPLALDDLTSENFQYNNTRDSLDAVFSSMPSHASSHIKGKNREVQSNPSINVSNNNSAEQRVCSKPEVADMLLRSILAALIRGENHSNTFRPAHLTNSIRSFYRTYATGPEETREFIVSIFQSIRDVLSDTRIQDRDDKSYCIFEEVDRAYYKEGWCLNTPTSSEPYECYCGKSFPKLEALRKHFDTHSPCQFIACPEPNCSHLSLRLDSMKKHLEVHSIYIRRLRPDEQHQKEQQLQQNTFLILDCTHDRCFVEGCNRKFPRHDINACRRSQAHILGHYKNKNSLPHSFRHICSDEEFCNGKEAWRKSIYVTGERIQELDEMDIDDLEEDL